MGIGVFLGAEGRELQSGRGGQGGDIEYGKGTEKGIRRWQASGRVPRVSREKATVRKFLLVT